MADRIQLRRDTAANWTAYNPILLQGEPGIEIDTDQWKLGDGVHTWSQLAYRGGECVQQMGNSTTVAMSQMAVSKEFAKTPYSLNDDSNADLDIGDGEGNVVLEIKGGHLKTKNFESDKISPQISNSDADLDIGDEEGNVLAELREGEIKTKRFDSRTTPSALSDVSEADLDIGDEEGNVVLEIKGGHLKTKNFDSRQSGNEVGIPDTIEGTTPLIIGEPIPTNYKRVKFLTQKETDANYQAMDFYGDYMVSLVESKAAGSYNYKVPFGYLYDVRSETKICDLVFPYPSSYATCHNNAAMFGAEFYNSNSEFPIFWINQWQTQKAFFGYDLQKQGNVYVPVLVQIIEPDSTLANSTTFGKAYGDFVIDKDNSKLYHLGYKNNFGDVICVSEYNMPTISDGVEQTIDGITCKVVTLTTNDVTDSYDTIPMTGFQDKCYSNGQIFVTYGYGNQTPYLAIAVINLIAKKVTHIINLSSDRTDMSHIIGTSAYRETEALAVYAGNRLMVGYYKEQEIYEVKL